MTVEGEHVYRVSLLGTLVHNNCPKGGTYKLVDPAEDAVRRTGRTGDLTAREKQLARGPDTKDLDFHVDRRTDVYAQQRGREQIIYEQHPEALFENGGLNKIRGIRTDHPNLQDYLDAAKEVE